MSLSSSPNSGNNGPYPHVAHLLSTTKWADPWSSIFHSLCGPLTQFSFQSLRDNEILVCVCIQEHSLTVMSVSNRTASPSSLLTSPSVRGLICAAAITQAPQLISNRWSPCFHQLFKLKPHKLLLSFTFSFKTSLISLYAYPNSFTLPRSPLPATHHQSLLLAPNIKQNPFPLESSTSPSELLLISVRASLFDSLQMSLNPLYTGQSHTHTHRCAHTDSQCNHKCSAVVTSVTNQDLCWPLCFQGHRQIVLPCTLMSVRLSDLLPWMVE